MTDHPSPGRRWLWVAFGVLLPIACFLLDPLFVVYDGGGVAFEKWELHSLATPYSGEALLLYTLVGIPMAGMVLHAIRPGLANGRVARPALALGLFGSLFFVLAMGPAYVFVLFGFWLLIPLIGLAPVASAWVYWDALSTSLRGRADVVRPAIEAGAGAVLLVAAALLPYVEWRFAVRELQAAQGTREVARAMDRVERFGPFGRRQLALAFLEASPAKRLRMEGLSIERRGSSLAEAAAKESKAMRRRTGRWD